LPPLRLKPLQEPLLRLATVLLLVFLLLLVVVMLLVLLVLLVLLELQGLLVLLVLLVLLWGAPSVFPTDGERQSVVGTERVYSVAVSNVGKLDAVHSQNLVAGTKPGSLGGRSAVHHADGDRLRVAAVDAESKPTTARGDRQRGREDRAPVPTVAAVHARLGCGCHGRRCRAGAICGLRKIAAPRGTGRPHHHLDRFGRAG
jgi:hypothetical protein